ncbi:hypothetical protein [Nocardia abscessus]|uniref:hypothetical protein n=1 Tax=Nocardia abscessus TaxID=120957 RepID=UPI0024581554|nr:hypothetical protein [Nocardia abscessus]
MITESDTCQLRGCDNPAAVPFVYEYGAQPEIRWRCARCDAQHRRNREMLDRYPY